jgi:hypothetical protein
MPRFVVSRSETGAPPRHRRRRKVGTTIARAAIAAGCDVAMSGSGAAERVALTVDVLATGAHAVETDEVVRHADLIVLAVPTHRFRELPRDLFADKILIDAMNCWEPIDGVDEELATAPAGTRVVVQDRFPSADTTEHPRPVPHTPHCHGVTPVRRGGRELFVGRVRPAAG